MVIGVSCYQFFHELADKATTSTTDDTSDSTTDEGIADFGLVSAADFGTGCRAKAAQHSSCGDTTDDAPNTCRDRAGSTGHDRAAKASNAAAEIFDQEL